VKFSFVEAPAFTRHLPDYMDDDEYRALQDALIKNPDIGDTIQATGGLHKLRWRDHRRGKGKRSGLRIIYYYIEKERLIWLFTLYSKDEAADLTADQKRAIKQAIKAEIKTRK